MTADAWFQMGANFNELGEDCVQNMTFIQPRFGKNVAPCYLFKSLEIELTGLERR